MSLDIKFISETFPEVLKAIPVTLLMTALPCILGAVLGFFVALIHIKKIPVINQILEVIISFFRSVPIIILRPAETHKLLRLRRRAQDRYNADFGTSNGSHSLYSLQYGLYQRANKGSPLIGGP